MAVPNVSEGRDLVMLEAIGRAFAPARFLDLHTDPDHDRAVFTLAAPRGRWRGGSSRSPLGGGERIDMRRAHGEFTRTSALST